MEIKSIDCKGCNNSCPLTVLVENKKVLNVSGNCCHRGIVSAKKQIEDSACTGKCADDGVPVKITCSGCSNRCYLEVIMEDGKVKEALGGGCRRAVISARRQLEG